jgi:penicillin-binding protein 1A
LLDRHAERSAELVLRDGSWSTWTLAEGGPGAPYVPDQRGPAPGRRGARAGDVVRVRPTKRGTSCPQMPQGAGALVSLDADTGAVRALVRRLQLRLNKFNRATQAQRQPGSSFKPFVYAAAFERGFNPARSCSMRRWCSAPHAARVAAAERQRHLRRADAPARGAW